MMQYDMIPTEFLKRLPMFAASLLISLLVMLPSGCHRSEDEPIKECDSYASMYDKCLHQLGNGAGSVTAQRAQRLRAALEQQIRGASDAKREELRTSCVAGLKQLEPSCR